MPTECTPELFEFKGVERRAVVASFDGGMITSNAGALLLAAAGPRDRSGATAAIAVSPRITKISA
jgi:hypothetical protein